MFFNPTPIDANKLTPAPMNIDQDGCKQHEFTILLPWYRSFNLITSRGTPDFVP
jgi:hypothetical protein